MNGMQWGDLSSTIRGSEGVVDKAGEASVGEGIDEDILRGRPAIEGSNGLLYEDSHLDRE